jgi:hypothetical protein
MENVTLAAGAWCYMVTEEEGVEKTSGSGRGRRRNRVRGTEALSWAVEPGRSGVGDMGGVRREDWVHPAVHWTVSQARVKSNQPSTEFDPKCKYLVSYL